MEGDDALFSKLTSNLSKTYKLAHQYATNANIKDFEQYQILGKSICEIETEFNHLNASLEKAKQEHFVEAFEKIYNHENDKSRDKIDPRNSRRYTELMSHLQSMTGGIEGQNDSMVDEENMGGGQIIPEFDPITKQPLKHPVRNIICKHVYEKRSVEQSLKINSRMRCPISGCVNNNPIKLSDLYDDLDLERILLSRQQNNEN